MILHRILDHDLHVKRYGEAGVLAGFENTVFKHSIPAVVSTSRGKFVIVRRLRPNNVLMSGVFPYDSDKLDDLIGPMVETCYELSSTENWPNIFPLSEDAFNYISENCYGQPHICLMPSEWTWNKARKFSSKLSKQNEPMRIAGICRVVQCNVKFPVFLSRPDFVGTYTQFLGGNSTLCLHNVKLSMAFCP